MCIVTHIESIFGTFQKEIARIPANRCTQYVSRLTNMVFSYCEKMVFSYCEKMVDVDARKIHIVKQINYIDRSIIYENITGTNGIKNMISYINDNLDELRNTTLPKNNIILRCETHGAKIDLKKIFEKYYIPIRGNTVGNILLFNGINPQEHTQIDIETIRSGKKMELKCKMTDVCDVHILNLFSRS